MTKTTMLCSACVTACLAIPLVADGQADRPLFAAASPVAVGPGSGQIVFADVDLDGHTDMVTRHLSQRRIGVFLGDGKGGFRPAARALELGYQPGWIASADLNGDRVPDIAVTSSERDEVDLFLGDGKSGFTRAPGAPFAASAGRDFYTRGLTLVDVNGDRRLDAVSANGRSHTFTMLFGDGRGRLTAGPTVKAGNGGERTRQTFEFGDVDADGNIDAVVATAAGDAEDGRVEVMRGDGTGAFRRAGPTIAVTPNPRALTLGDLNGDGRPDLLVSHGEAAEMTVLLNDGRGTFTPAVGSPVQTGAGTFAIVVADVDGNGKPDAIAATGTSAAVLLGDGRGRFAPAPGSPFRTGPGAYGIAAKDINADGNVDVATSSFEGDAVTVLLGR